jgi:uncharacterized membrane protein YdjX (TVP38/TMEM64 family)
MTRALLFAGVVFALILAWWSGIYAEASPEKVAELVSRAGVLGPLFFVALFVAAELVHFPGILFVFAAAGLWPLWVAIPTAYAGAVLGAFAVFVIARRIVPPGLRDHLPEPLLRYESLLESHGLLTVIGLRLVLFMAPAVHWLLGASRVSRRNYALGTAIGLLPGVVLFALLGRAVQQHWPVLRPWVYGGIALALTGVLLRPVLQRLRPRATPSP